MSLYAVNWHPDAVWDLADIWLQAGDQAGVTGAQATADQLLATDPLGSGQHRSEGLYRLVVSPLILFFNVDPVQRTVEVSRVWYSP